MATDFYSLVDELDGTNTLTETIRVPEDKSIIVGGFRFLIHNNNASGGTFTFSLKDAAANTLFSEAITTTNLDTAEGGSGNDYYGVWYNLTVSEDITLLPGQYTFNLTDTSGYSYAANNWVGWARPHENRYIGTDYTVSSMLKLPYGLEIWSYQNGN